MKKRTWVLDTETKGTGAQMVPLENVLKDPSSPAAPLFVPPARRPRPEPEPQPKAPRRFRVVDVHISVWDPDDERWRLLSFAEQKAIWALRER